MDEKEQVRCLYNDIDDDYILSYALRNFNLPIKYLKKQDLEILLNLLDNPDPGTDEYFVDQKIRELYYGK